MVVDNKRKILDLASRVETALNERVKDAAKAAGEAMVRGTPVDTGLARSNNIASLDAPVDIVIPPYYPIPQGTDPDKFDETQNADAAIRQHAEVIDQRQPGQDIFFTNNVDYAFDLDQLGTSRQSSHFTDAARIAGGIEAERPLELEGGV